LQFAKSILQNLWFFSFFVHSLCDEKEFFVSLQSKEILMMHLHIFNPEHDIALASNLANFTAPHAGRKMREDLGFLPAFWAEDGDFVLVDDVEAALNSVRHFKQYIKEVVFVTLEDLQQLPPMEISPWGWDRALKGQLIRAGVESYMLPSDGQLATIRTLSNRCWATKQLLPEIMKVDDRLIGESFYLQSPQEVRGFAYPYVLKAPWSSSGRGIRYVEEITTHLKGWIANVIQKQGGVMLEPYYQKVMDFAMEFESTDDGVLYSGLSLFHTEHGAYSSNILASENEKLRIISKYISSQLLDAVSQKIAKVLSSLFHESYRGPFGVDMMIVSDKGKLKLHPCVELNLRRTMGHVALSFKMQDTDARKEMQIAFDDNYHLHIVSTNENVINNSLM
jgi:hypothetical protein